MRKTERLYDIDIHKGRKVDPLEFGNLLFQRKIVGQPMISDSRLIYGIMIDGTLVYAEMLEK